MHFRRESKPYPLHNLCERHLRDPLNPPHCALSRAFQNSFFSHVFSFLHLRLTTFPDKPMAVSTSASTFSNPRLLHKVSASDVEVINQYEINVKPRFPFQKPESSRFSRLTPLCATLRSPKGFGPSPKKSEKKNKMKRGSDDDDDGDDGEEEEELAREQGVIPEVVTNRMISRMGFSVGIPLAIGLMFFPFFYYLKVGLKIDVPTWVPFIVSFFFFGSALLGVSYGIVSSSWDPLREGSLLGWNEAQKNWPVFWQSIWGGGSSNIKKK